MPSLYIPALYLQGIDWSRHLACTRDPNPQLSMAHVTWYVIPDVVYKDAASESRDDIPR